MKVALIHYRLILRGGLETRLINYATYFRKNGDHVTIIFAKKSDEVELPGDIELKQIKLGWTPKVFRQKKFSKKVKSIIDHSDYDFVLSLGRTQSQDAVLAPGNHLGYLKAINKKFLSLSDRAQIALDKESYNKSKIIFAASNMMKTELIELYRVPEEKIVVLYPPLNTENFNLEQKLQRNKYRETYQLDNQFTYFLFVSTGHTRKGLPLLLNIFEQMQYLPVKLLIAGFPEVKTNLLNVSFIGFVKEMEKLYPAVDCVLHPSIYEPFGQIVSESIACGTPVIVSDRVGAAEIVTKKSGEIVPFDDLKAWKSAVENFNSKVYAIDQSFVNSNKLALEDHMEKMLHAFTDNYQ